MGYLNLQFSVYFLYIFSWIHQFRDQTIKVATLMFGFIAYSPTLIECILVSFSTECLWKVKVILNLENYIRHSSAHTGSSSTLLWRGRNHPSTFIIIGQILKHPFLFPCDTFTYTSDPLGYLQKTKIQKRDSIWATTKGNCVVRRAQCLRPDHHFHRIHSMLFGSCYSSLSC